MFFKIGALKPFLNSLKNYVEASLLIQLQAWDHKLCLKSDFGTGVFQWLFRIFYEHLRATVDLKIEKS